MAARTPISGQRDFRRFSTVLSSAVSEWILMLLLFLDAFFSYLLTKFAHLCKLQNPCILCSRLDHVLGNEKPGFYRNLICDAHKSEISSLAYCHVHRRLADVHDMCEHCLLSYATENKSNSETYRSLVGKLGVYDSENVNLETATAADGDCLQDSFQGDKAAKVPLLKKDPTFSLPVTRNCSCCSEPFTHKTHAKGLLQSRSDGVVVSEADISISAGLSRLRHQDWLSEKAEKSLVSTVIHRSGNQGFDRLSHIGYAELKITSDSESEVSFSENDDGNELGHGAEDLKECFMPQCPEPNPVTIIPNRSSATFSDDVAQEKLIHPAPLMPEPSESIPHRQLHVRESLDASSLASTIAIGHGLEELNWSQVDVKADPSSSKTMSQNSQQVPSEVSNVNDDLESGDVVDVSNTSGAEVSKITNEKNLRTRRATSEPGPCADTHMDLNDAYKLAVGAKGSLTSPTFTDVIIGKDSFKVHEDLKSLISQISASRGLESPWNDMNPSPRVYGQGDEPVLQNITKRISLERNESDLSLDGSIVSEVEGESAAERLKRQVELDRKSISLLYKELEEERNASAIATNQAMAMITRLQEEKAAMQMEALQYQRMMEEQAEYDQETLQRSNELLSEREKEIQDLQYELESLRKRFGDKTLADYELEPFRDSEVKESNPTSTPGHKESGVYDKLQQKYMIPIDSQRCGSSPSEDTLLDYKDEKIYISDCLKKLEKRLHLYSNNGVFVQVSRFDAQEFGPADIHGENHEQKNAMLEDGVRINGQYSEEPAEGNDMEHPHWSELSISSDNGRQQFVMGAKETDLATLENEISSLNERLEALEADHNFLEHAINSLRNGDDGVQFIQEIACHLRELRRIGIMRSSHTVA